MPVVSTSAALVRGRVVRLTLLDACGMPQITNSVYVTDGFITVAATKNVDTGDEIKVRYANGIIGVHEPGQRSAVNVSLDINLAKIDPAAIAMITGDPLVVDYSGNTVGFEERGLIPITRLFALEVWTATSAVKCSSGAASSGYMLYPMVGQGYVTFDNVADKEVTAHIMAESYGNPSWGKGPYGIAPTDGSSIPGPVASGIAVAGVIPPGRLTTAVDPIAHRHFEITPIAAPAAFTTPGPISMTLPTAY